LFFLGRDIGEQFRRVVADGAALLLGLYEGLDVNFDAFPCG
jgi:hypothetical protein